MNKSSNKNWIEKITHLLHRDPHDRDELLEILKDAGEKNLIDHEALRMIEGVMRISHMQAGDIMIPRGQMIVIERDNNFNDILPLVIESHHSRFPVIESSRDEIVGILLAKDLLSINNAKQFDIDKLIRKAIFIPEGKRLDALLKDFRLNHNHMAFVLDEYGGVTGLVTIEDVLEQIVGDIEDEYDIEQDEPMITLQHDNVYHIKGLTSIEEINSFFDCNLSSSDNDTIAGFIIERLGYLPKISETIDIDQLHFEVINADNRRIFLLAVSRLNQVSNENDDKKEP